MTRAVNPIGYWGNKPIYLAKIGDKPQATIVCRSKGEPKVEDWIKFKTLDNTPGMCVESHRWRTGIVRRIEDNRIFLDLL